MSGFVVVVKDVVVVITVVVVVRVVVVRVVVFIVTVVVVEEEYKGEMVSVKLTSVREVVFTVVETEAVRSFSIVVIKSTLSSGALFCTVVITAVVVNIAPAETNKNIEMTFMRITTFLVFPETS